VKRVLTVLLLPVAKAADALSGWSRLWAHARLSARLRHRLHPTVVVLGAPEVHGTGNIRFGRSLYLYRELYFETREQGAVVIGDDVVISRGVHIVSFGRIEIGEYTSIRDANHCFGGGEPLRHSGHRAAAVSIGCNVWIGRGVSVLAGVRIGDGAVVGANAVVTSNVPAGAVVAGAPARPLAGRLRA